MIITILIALLAPITVFLGLIVFGNVTLVFIMFHGCVCVGVPLIDLLIIKKKSIKDIYRYIGLENFKKSILPAVIIGTVFLISIYLFFTILEKSVLDINQINELLTQWNINNKYIYLFLFMMIIANSCLEETFWRGYIFKRLSTIVKPLTVIILSSVFYCSYHLITTVNIFSIPIGAAFTTIIFFAGIFWGYVRYKYKSIYIPIISHFLADLSIMLIYVKYFA
jgi:membrane protease YdiL (CAAX protease family)